MKMHLSRLLECLVFFYGALVVDSNVFGRYLDPLVDKNCTNIATAHIWGRNDLQVQELALSR
jgi:hypothetical protein